MFEFMKNKRFRKSRKERNIYFVLPSFLALFCHNAKYVIINEEVLKNLVLGIPHWKLLRRVSENIFVL